MQTDSCREGFERLGEPRIELIRRGVEWGRRDAEVLDGVH